MSKKSRRRNKKLLAMLALAGGAAMMGRGKGTTGKGFLKSGAAGGASLADLVEPAAVTSKKDVLPIAAPSNVVTDRVPIGRMRGAGSDADAIAGQKIRANYAQRGRYVNPNEQTAAAGAAYVPRIPRVHARGVGLRMKSGGRVTGIAKRGFGRALGRGKK